MYGQWNANILCFRVFDIYICGILVAMYEVGISDVDGFLGRKLYIKVRDNQLHDIWYVSGDRFVVFCNVVNYFIISLIFNP